MKNNWQDYYTGNFHAERDLGWEEEQCSATKKWSMTKRTILNTWTIYERVGFPSYQTPRFYFQNEKQALKKIQELSLTLPKKFY